MVFVERAACQSGDKPFPDAGPVVPDLQVVRLGVPVVEVAHHGDSLGVRRPYGELRAGDAVDLHYVSAELVVEPEVAALLEKVYVLVGKSAYAVDNAIYPF